MKPNQPNVEKGQIWRHTHSVIDGYTWCYSYFLILDIGDGVISDWEYKLLPLTPAIDNTERYGCAYPLNHQAAWEFVQ